MTKHKLSPNERVSYELFGFIIHRKERYFQEFLEIPNPKPTLDFHGFSALAKEFPFIYLKWSLSDQTKWSVLLSKWIRFTVIDLLISGHIKISVYKEIIINLHGLGTFTKLKYGIEPVSFPENGSILSKAIMRSLGQTKETGDIRPKIRKIIFNLLSQFDNAGSARPERPILLDLLEQYSQVYHWIQEANEENFIGIETRNTYSLNEEVAKRLDLEREAIKEYYTKVVVESKSYKAFFSELSKSIHKVLQQISSSNSN